MQREAIVYWYRWLLWLSYYSVFASSSRALVCGNRPSSTHKIESFQTNYNSRRVRNNWHPARRIRSKCGPSFTFVQFKQWIVFDL
jgi:hypothetical protein